MITNAVKLIEMDDNTATVAGYGVVFGGKDLDTDSFEPDTDYQLDLVPDKPVYYDHSLNDKLDYPIGTVERTSIKIDEKGIWVQAQLDRSKAYVEEVLQLIKEGVLGWSSGSVGHLARKVKGAIKIWPIIEFSLTPTPAEPRTLGVERIKNLAIAYPKLEALLETEEAHPVGNATQEESKAKMLEGKTKENIMSEEVQAGSGIEITRDEFDTRWEEMSETIKNMQTSFSEKIEAVTTLLEKMPAQKKAGYVTEPEESTESGIKTFGDFLVSVRRNDVQRLTRLYKATKDMSSTTGGGGGYLVPDDFSNALLRVMEVENQISSRVFNMPVTTLSGSMPILDVFVAPTAGSGQTAYSSVMSPAVVAEGAAYGEDQPTFELLRWQVKKIGEIVDVPAELIDDSGVSIETLLTRIFAIAIDAMVERNIIRGVGNTEFLGILNSAAAIGITPAANNAFGETDALEMLSRFKPMPGGSPVWIMHRGVIPDFNNFTSSNTDMVEWRQQLPSSLLGYPILFSEHVPQDDNAGNVILADLSAYILFNRKQLTIAFSEHAKFENDLVVWKYHIRADGMPWMKSAITLADPQGSYTVSPFVYHND